MQDENNISISEKNEMECNVQWPTINLLAEFSKMSLTSSVQESKFVYICDEFIDKIKDKVESIQYFHSKLTKSLIIFSEIYSIFTLNISDGNFFLTLE